MIDVTDVKRFMDADNLIKVWPGKQKSKLIVLEYLAGQFELGVQYTEKEVNVLLQELHSFNDVALLRRALFDYGFMDRTRDGAQYWVVERKAERQSDAI